MVIYLFLIIFNIINVIIVKHLRYANHPNIIQVIINVTKLYMNLLLF